MENAHSPLFIYLKIGTTSLLCIYTHTAKWARYPMAYELMKKYITFLHLDWSNTLVVSITHISNSLISLFEVILAHRGTHIKDKVDPSIDTIACMPFIKLVLSNLPFPQWRCLGFYQKTQSQGFVLLSPELLHLGSKEKHKMLQINTQKPAVSR